MRTINSFERLKNHYLAVRDGDIRFLVVVGRGGIGKSCMYEEVFPSGKYNHFTGRTTAIEIYCQAYDHPDIPIILDDVGSLLHHCDCIELLKSLCDSREQRVVQWHTKTPFLEGRNKKFIATGPVLMVCNRALFNNEDVNAVMDRADVVEFAPPKDEILRKLRTYAEDEEILQFLEQPRVQPSLRSYEKAKMWKASPHLHWKQELMDECGIEEHIQIQAEIIRNEPSAKQCYALYKQRTGRSRRDYYNHLPLAKELATAAVGNREHFCTTQAQTNEGGL